MSKHIVYAELHVHGCTAELYLNGIPLRRCASPASPSASIPVHEYLVPGANALEVVVEPGPTPSAARTTRTAAPPAGASVTARLVQREAQSFGDGLDGEELAALAWNGPANEAVEFPLALHVEKDLGPRAGRWAWQDAPALVLDDATRAEIAAVVATVADAFESGRPAKAVDLLEVRFAEHARAYPDHDPRTPRSELSSSVRRAANEGWSVRALDAAAHDFRLCAGGRLVEIVDEDWAPSLRFAPGGTVADEPVDEEEIPVPMLLGRIDGRLCVVR